MKEHLIESDIEYELKSELRPFLNSPRECWDEWELDKYIYIHSPSHNFHARIREIIKE